MIKDWIKDSKLLDKIEEWLVYNKIEILSKLGIKLWHFRGDI